MLDCCRRLKALLGDYLDGELDEQLCQEMESHLGDCQPCRAVVDTTRRTIQLYCDERPVELPADVQQRLFERLRAAQG